MGATKRIKRKKLPKPKTIRLDLSKMPYADKIDLADSLLTSIGLENNRTFIITETTKGEYGAPTVWMTTKCPQMEA